MINQIPFPQLGFKFLQIESEEEPHSLLNILPEYGFAVVGTRYPQRKSFEFLEKIIADLRGSNLVIVSGFARGIDSRAHELAIEHGLKTIAILGCGLNIDYPRENWNLRKKILNHGGLIISPFEANAAALPQNFLNRNQIIAHFAKAVWVVEAAAISGTLNTAHHADTLNRDLYATPCFPNDPFFEGNQKLLGHEFPNKYPVAEALYGINSLQKTWGNLKKVPEKKKKIDRRLITKIQKWILDLKYENGECRVQALMNFAISEGMSPGQFYQEYKVELDQGKISENLAGIVDLV